MSTILAIVSAAAICTFGILRAFQRPELQGRFQDAVQWKHWRLRYQMLAVFGLSLGGAVLGKFVELRSWAAVLPALPEAMAVAVVAGLSAVGVHKVSRDAAAVPADKEAGSIRTLPRRDDR